MLWSNNNNNHNNNNNNISLIIICLDKMNQTDNSRFKTKGFWLQKKKKKKKKNKKVYKPNSNQNITKKKKMAYILIIIHCNDCGSGEFKLHFSCVWRHNLKKKKIKIKIYVRWEITAWSNTKKLDIWIFSLTFKNIQIYL